MISCSNCGHEELAGALFCSECGARLIPPSDVGATVDINTTGTDSFDNQVKPIFPPPPIEPGEHDAKDYKVAIYVPSIGDMIYLEGAQEFTLGRSTSGQTIVPDVDLSPYQAYEAGVSRLHANIIVKGSDVFVQDLGSANGTRLNGKRLYPHVERPLNHGDILTLGKLKLQILIRE